jgi:hypothetical protein
LLKTLFALVFLGMLAAAGYGAWYVVTPIPVASLPATFDLPPGTRFRWTAGRASFFIPARATTMTLPLRAVFPGKNGQLVIVSVSVDDHWLADVQLPDPDAWRRASLPLPRRSTPRRFRRVDLRVNRVAVGVFILGVMTGELDFAY